MNSILLVASPCPDLSKSVLNWRLSVWGIHFDPFSTYIIEFLIKLPGSFESQPRKTPGVITGANQQHYSSSPTSLAGKNKELRWVST